MYRCTRRGALLKTSAYFVLWLTIALPAEVSSTEFSNILSSVLSTVEAEAKAKQASVEALDALSKVFAAIRTIEADGLDAGKGQLREAVGILRTASRLMSEVEFGSPDMVINYEQLSEEDKVALQSLKQSKTIGEVYSSFAGATEQIAADIEGAVNAGGAVFPQFSNRLAIYIDQGGAISRVFARIGRQ